MKASKVTITIGEHFSEWESIEIPEYELPARRCTPPPFPCLPVAFALPSFTNNTHLKRKVRGKRRLWRNWNRFKSHFD